MSALSIIPTVLDSSPKGERAFDIYSLLLKERIVFLGQQVDDHIANLLVAEMLYLDAADPDKDIFLYINSPGGLSYAGMAIYDVMQHVRAEVSTVCVGMGMSAAAMILCAGASGKRLATPNAKIMIHQGSAGTQGAPRDMEIHLREVLATTKRMAQIISFHSGQPVERVEHDIDRDYFMTADEARRYGIIDEVITPKRGISAELLAVADEAATRSARRRQLTRSSERAGRRRRTRRGRREPSGQHPEDAGLGRRPARAPSGAAQDGVDRSGDRRRGVVADQSHPRRPPHREAFHEGEDGDSLTDRHLAAVRGA